MRFPLLTAYAAFACLPLASSNDSNVRTVYEFPENSYLENLAVRRNGDILISNLSKPQLYLIDPSSSKPIPALVHEFSDSLGLAGIAEYQPDVFAVISGNASFTSNISSAGTWKVWSVDMKGVRISSKAGTAKVSGKPKVSLIAHVTSAQFLNGISLLSAADQTLLVGDVNGGVIWRLSIETGHYEVAINNTFTHLYASPPFSASGVDGVHVRDGRAYFTNFGNGTFNTVDIESDGTPVGPVTTIARIKSPHDQYDDFTFDCSGNAYLVTGGGNTIEMVSADGEQQYIIAGDLNSTAIAEPTACAFGRGVQDQNILYVVTAGGLQVPVSGTTRIGGQLVAVRTHTKGGSCQ